MKTKLLIIAGIALLFFSSCEKNGGDQTEEKTPINFVNPWVVGATKAIDKTSSWVSGDKVGIFANANPGTDFSYMPKNTELVYNTSWTYGTDAYWPVDESTVTFFAYYPYSASTVEGITTAGFGTSEPVNAVGTFKITHIANTDLTLQTDLLWDWVVGATKSAPSGAGIDTGNENPETRLAFKHALSKVRFTSKLTEAIANTKIYITGLEVTAMKMAEFTTTDANTAEALPSWAPATTSAKFAVLSLVDDSKTCEVLTESKALNVTSGNEANFELLMVPQLAAGVSIKLNYEVVTTVDGTDNPAVKGVETFAVTQPWIQGMLYTYNFSLGLHKITFDVDATPGWGAGTGGLQ